MSTFLGTVVQLRRLVETHPDLLARTVADGKAAADAVKVFAGDLSEVFDLLKPLFPTEGETMQPTAAMKSVGFSFLDLAGYAKRLSDLLQKDGAAVADLVATGMKLITAVSGKDLGGIISALESGSVDVQQIVADIRAAFDL